MTTIHGPTTTARRAGRLLFAVLGLGLGAAPAAAQINVENFAHVGFNFSAPGARSGAMGGAFISLADDATAAETNPAGLTTLLRPEISFEYKGVQYTREVPPEAGGALDTGTEFTDQVAIPSFASLVIPVGGITFGAFRHELVNYRSQTYAVGAECCGGTYLFPYTTDLQMRVENYGGAVAMRMGSVSIGLAGGVSRLAMELQYQRYRVARFQEAYLQNQVVVSEEDGQQNGFFVNAGVLLRPSERFSVGAVYRLRPKFGEMRLQSLDALGDPFTGLNAPPDTSFVVNVPDAIGAGFSVRPHDLLTLTLDAVWNRYSQIADTMSFTFVPEEGAFSAEDFVVDDGLDIHAGAEFIALLGNTYLALRGGASLASASNTYYVGPHEATRQLFGDEPGDPIATYTAGFGTAIWLLQLDVAGTFSEDRAQVIASGVLRFGR